MRLFHLTSLLLVAGSLLVACGGATPGQSSPPAGASAEPAGSASSPSPGGSSQAAAEPVDLDALGARELTALPPVHNLAAPDGAWSIAVPSRQAPELTDVQGVAHLRMSIGTEAPLECFIYREALDPGGTIAGAMKSTDKLTFKAIEPLTIEAVGTVPILFARGIYLVKQASGDLAGELKLAVASHHAWAIACHHDELGYEKTLTEIMRGIVKSFTFKTTKQATYETLGIARLGERRIGYERLAVYPLPKSRVAVHQAGTFALPQSQRVFSFMDYVTVEAVDQAGRLVKGAWASAMNGALKLSISVAHGQGGKHSVSGSKDGRQIQAELVTKDQQALPGILLEATQLRAKLAPGASVDVEQYIPQDDPTKLTIRTLTVDAQQASRYSFTTTGGNVVTAVADAAGLSERSEMQLPNGSAIVMERVAESGKL